MALNLNDKKAIVADLSSVVSGSVSALAADYRGLTVVEMTELRAKARDCGVYVQIVRNTLARKAVEGTEYACMTEALTGPLVLMFSKEEPSAPARLVRDFAKTNDKLEVKALALNGELLGPESLAQVASLPSYDEGIAMLMSVMQAPVTKFVRTLSETYAQAVRVVSAVGDQKKAA